MTHSTPLVFFGSDDFSLEILRALVAADYQIGLVVTTNPPKQLNVVFDFANEMGLRAITPSRFERPELSTLQETDADYAVLASYGRILPASVLAAFKSIVNVHPSLLPRWRGPSPIEAAILSGEDKTGVSLMKLATKMDAGPVYAQSELALQHTEDQQSLRQTLAGLGAELLIKNLPSIVKAKLAAKPQNETQASYCPLIKKSDGQLNWHKSATQLERQIRAYSQWPRSSTTLFGKEVIVTEAQVETRQLEAGQIATDNDELLVGCAQQSLLLKRLRPAGRAEMSGADFLRGLHR